MNKEFVSIIFGDQSLASFLAYFVLAVFGILVSLLIHATSRDVKSYKTPVQFSWKFLLTDNAKRIVLSLCCVFIALRFTDDLLQFQINPWIALCIGLGIDYIVGLIKNATKFLQQKRPS